MRKNFQTHVYHDCLEVTPCSLINELDGEKGTLISIKWLTPIKLLFPISWRVVA